MFVVPNLTLIVQDLAFFILLVLLARYLYRPIQNVLAARTKRIEEGLRAAEEAKKERAAADKEYQQRMDEARREGQQLLDRISKQGEDLRRELEEKARQEAEAIIARARSEIEGERQRAVQDLRRQVVDLAMLAASRVVGESLDGSKHRQLIDRTIQEAEIRA